MTHGCPPGARPRRRPRCSVVTVPSCATLVGAGWSRGLVTLPATGAPATARSATDQSYSVPASRVLTLHGHGFGHGHGMSQYGAYGAAKQGLGYRQIIDFYYPGTSWSTVDRRACGC